MAKLVITSIEIKKLRLVLPKQTDGSVTISASVKFEGDGDFSEYVENKELNPKKIAMDILSGKLKIKQRP